MTQQTSAIDNPTDPEGDEPDIEEAKKLANEQLRTHTKKVEDENSELREQVLRSHLKEIGLDYDTGLGKAIGKEYEGAYTIEALSEYAQAEYGHEVSTEQKAPDEAAQQRQQSLQQQSQPMEPQPEPTQAEKAAERMHDPDATREDAVRSLSGKVTDFVAQHYGPEGPQGPPPDNQ